jgi:hypothetical protein
MLLNLLCKTRTYTVLIGHRDFIWIIVSSDEGYLLKDVLMSDER